MVRHMMHRIIACKYFPAFYLVRHMTHLTSNIIWH